MALIHELSTQTPLAEFELFAVPPTQTTVERDIITEHRPLSTVTANQPIEFAITSSPDEYINFRETIFHLKLHLELSKGDRSNITDADWDKVYPVNNVLHSIFEQIELSIGDTQINTSHSTYQYRAYLDTLLKIGKQARESYLTAGGYLSETDRKKLFKTKETAADKKSLGKTVELAGKLHLDLAFQNRAILGGSNIKLKLEPARKEFYLMCTDAVLNINVVFEDASLMVHRSKVMEPIVVAHSQALNVSPAKYPINRVEVKQFSIPKGSLDVFIDNAITGQLPNRTYIALVSNAAANGDLKKDPFKFEHFKTNFVACHYNSIQYPPKAFKPDFPKELYSREYLSLFETANQLNPNPEIDISLKNYKDNTTIFGFNFSPDLAPDCNTCGHANVIKRGSLRVEMHFAEQLTEAVTVLLYAEYDCLLQITKERNGYVEF